MIRNEDVVAPLATQMNGSTAGGTFASRAVALSSTLSGLLLLLSRP
jgi:hypothetical protein